MDCERLCEKLQTLDNRICVLGLKLELKSREEVVDDEEGSREERLRGVLSKTNLRSARFSGRRTVASFTSRLSPLGQLAVCYVAERMAFGGGTAQAERRCPETERCREMARRASCGSTVLLSANYLQDCRAGPDGILPQPGELLALIPGSGHLRRSHRPVPGQPTILVLAIGHLPTPLRSPTSELGPTTPSSKEHGRESLFYPGRLATLHAGTSRWAFLASYIKQATLRLLQSSDDPTLIRDVGLTHVHASTSHSYHTFVSSVWRHMLTSSSVSGGKYRGFCRDVCQHVSRCSCPCQIAGAHLEREEDRKPRDHVLALGVDTLRVCADFDFLTQTFLHLGFV